MADKRGFPILGDTTIAVTTLASQAMRGKRATGTRRRRKKKATTTKRRRKTTTRRTTRGKKKRLVKGSAAAKRHMARLRKMRKR